jgi:hypothetical protein
VMAGTPVVPSLSDHSWSAVDPDPLNESMLEVSRSQIPPEVTSAALRDPQTGLIKPPRDLE